MKGTACDGTLQEVEFLPEPTAPVLVDTEVEVLAAVLDVGKHFMVMTIDTTSVRK